MSAPTDLFLSRARLRHDAPMSALRELLSRGDGIRTAAGHRLVWSLFAHAPEAQRDFLWREAEPGTFYLLSARPPDDQAGIFRLDPPKRFAPSLAPGDRLRFVLRVNATVSRKAVGKPGTGGRTRGGRCDIVMDALHDVPPDQRAEQRRKILPAIAAQWLARQGEAHGFSLLEREEQAAWEAADGDSANSVALQATGYRVLKVTRGSRGKPMQLGVLDLQGTIAVREPARFLAALKDGFGHAKAFGCGLMLIRRDA